MPPRPPAPDNVRVPKRQSHVKGNLEVRLGSFEFRAQSRGESGVVARTCTRWLFSVLNDPTIAVVSESRGCAHALFLISSRGDRVG